MKTFREVKSFLDVTSYQETSAQVPDAKRGLFPFVTISRQYGAGGRKLAAALMEAMSRHRSRLFQGWRTFDRKLCEELSQDRELKHSLDSVFSEECLSEIDALVRNLLGVRLGQPAAIAAMFRAIRTVATRGKVIIVGRAGSCVTASLRLGVHVRLTAPVEYRIGQMGIDDREPAKSRRELDAVDRDRARLVKTYFRRDIDDPELYDVIWNTAKVPIPVIARATMALLEEKVARNRQAEVVTLS